MNKSHFSFNQILDLNTWILFFVIVEHPFYLGLEKTLTVLTTKEAVF